MIRGYNLKLIAICLMMIFIFQISFPTISFALTGGPSQPEVGSFEPVGTSQMVDLYTGDFNYNIPLLNVPGSNGSYPINIAYHGGIGMEQEASWVGLGWNINPGAIVRQMRGIPDDFKGDKLTKRFTIKDDWTVGISPGIGNEIFGVPLPANLSPSLNLYYNSYRGVGYNIGIQTSATKSLGGKDNKNPLGLSGSLGLRFDSQGGLSAMPSLSLSKMAKDKNYALNIGGTMNSSRGITDLNTSGNVSKKIKGKQRTFAGAGSSFTSNGYIPGIQNPMKSVSFTGSLDLGLVVGGNNIKGKGKLNYSNTTVKDNTRKIESYGLIYSEEANSSSVMDFNREKDGEISKQSPYTPVPVRTNDIYSIQGQGTGGVFRAFRGDIGFLKDPVTENKGTTSSLSVEASGSIAPSLEIALGAGGSFGFDRSYSGQWKNGKAIAQLKNRYQNKFSQKNSEFENFYFKSIGEQTSTNLNDLDNVGGEEPIAFDLAFIDVKSDIPSINFKTKALNRMDNKMLNLQDRGNREKRNQHIEYFTKKELQGKSLSSKGKDHHIHKIEVRNSDGNLYSYALPVYNTYHIDASFSVESPSEGESDSHAYGYNKKVVEYDAGLDNSLNNNKGQENYFTSTSIPAYSHSHMLTSIQSADYVDVDGNDKVSEQDFGFWVKFAYDKVQDYKWRFPYGENEANYARGNYSNIKDDKASYSYGTKDLYYLDTVETNTHIAIFEKGYRKDGLGVKGEDGGRGTTAQKLLKKISLYSKSDKEYDKSDPSCFARMIPIKEVHFVYDYSLCKKLPSNNNASPNLPHELRNEGGKLTLKKIYFTHLNNDKGSLTPYEFDYSSSNPDYQTLEVDRWGNFQNDVFNENYVDNPYSNQDGSTTGITNRNSDISSWNLTKIKLPSGAEINVEYESDDYLYVQNSKAQQMFELVGFSSTSNKKLSDIDSTLSMTKNRVFFKSSNTLTPQEVDDRISGIKHLYFKAFMNLKKNASGTGYHKDYVSGYAEIENFSGGVCTDNSNYGYFDLKLVDYKGRANSGNQRANPIQMAAWKYLRYQRADLYNKYGKGFNAIKNNVKRLINDAGSLMKGYYNQARTKNLAGSIGLSKKSNVPKSYVRLNSVEKKYGGGHRVKSIKINTLWGSGNEEFGQEYSYVLPDGETSSGVAEYEPLSGGDEISLRQPKYFNKKQGMIMKHLDFKEDPYGESYFPGAKVGYSRVVVKNLQNAKITMAQTGVSVNEFFTSKDFPVVVKKYDETVKHKGFNINIPIPLVGQLSLNNNGYSNGYTIFLNDMPGKPKSVSTYPYSTDYRKFSNGNPVSATRYNYQTKSITTDDGSPANILNNRVTVLDAHGVKRIANIGETYDFFIDESENSSYGMNAGTDANINILPAPIPVPVPTVFPSIDYYQSSYRHVITNKIISRNGVLKSVENITDGSKVVATNELYDAETGQVLMTSSDNEHKEPIYNYTYAAHWAYDRMGGAYENYRIVLNPSYYNGSKVYGLDPTVIKVADVIKLGDKIALTSNFDSYGFVTEIDITNNQFTLLNKFGQPASLGLNELIILKSGNTNMQSVSNGNIVSFYDPSRLTTFDLFKNLFELFNKRDTLQGYKYIHDIVLCDGREIDEINYGGGGIIAIEYKDTTRTSGISYCEYVITPANVENTTKFLINTIKNVGDTLITFDGITQGTVNNYTMKLATDYICRTCDKSPILQASAIEFCDTCWQYNYVDVGSPVNENNDVITHNISQFNPFYYGQKGVWRTQRSWAYQADRKQSGSLGDDTRINIDGQFDFVPFSWIASTKGNYNWTWASEITRYSPYGYQLENRNPLNIYSSEMYGYNNTVVTAVGSNASYMEVAFDGFEDYSGLSQGNWGHSLGFKPINHGHLNFTYPSGNTAIVKEAHTGNYCLEVADGNTLSYTWNSVKPYNFFTPKVGKKYLLSAWVKTKDNSPAVFKVIVNGTDIYGHTENSKNFEEIDGWTKVEVEFEIPSSLSSFVIEINEVPGSPNHARVDDIRISPFNGGMKTYVYNPQTLWLIAELDNLNYATFYNYDEEGSLTQIKKETNEGIVTIKSTRNNTARRIP